VPTGWYDLVHSLCEDVVEILGESAGAFEVRQIKQKLGILRFYFGMPDGSLREEIKRRVVSAEEQSSRTCEVCGRGGRLHNSASYILTACDMHSRGAAVER
jgi:hypothetical protein